MGVKSDKTFEEIVERLVALFRPQDAKVPGLPDEQPTSTQPAGAPPTLSPTAAEDDTQ